MVGWFLPLMTAMFVGWQQVEVDGAGTDVVAWWCWRSAALPQGMLPGGPPALALEVRGDFMGLTRNCDIEKK